MKIVKIDSRNNMRMSGWIIAQYVVYILSGLYLQPLKNDILYHFQELKTRRRSYLNYLVVVLVVCYIQVTNALSIRLHFCLSLFLLTLTSCPILGQWWGHGRCQCTKLSLGIYFCMFHVSFKVEATSQFENFPSQ